MTGVFLIKKATKRLYKYYSSFQEYNMSNFKRRDFLRLGTGLVGGFALGAISCNNSAETTAEKPADSSNASTPTGTALAAFGIQLYSLRDDFPKDPKAILKQVADMGYTQVEGFERDKGIFWGMSDAEFKSYMNEIGLTMISTHCNTDKDFEKKAAQAAAAGLKYLVYPFEGAGKTIDDYKKMAADFNKKGEICKTNGIRFAFHNHAPSFKQINGEYPQDILMTGTDPGLVDYEIDLYWVVAAGADPEAWLKKYPNRFTLCHVKDRTKKPVEDDGKNSVDLGTGSIDYSKILKTAKENGMQYYIVEQEAYPNGTPLEAAKADAEYMKKLVF
jgi:sugar phosphate isomerase/epimerase